MSTQSLLTFLEGFQSSRIRSPLLRLSPSEPRHPAGFSVSACVVRLSHLRPELPVLRYCQTPAHRLVAVELVLGCRWTTRLEWVRCSAATKTSVPVATTSHRCPSSVNIESQGAISRRDKNIHIWRETACPKTAYPSRVLRVFLTMKRIRLARRSSYTWSLSYPSFRPAFVMTAADNSLEALDPAYVADVLSRPPFVQISGICNVRDLGSYPTASPNLITKPGYAFRGAEVSHITEQGALASSQTLRRLLMPYNVLGIQQMRALGITTVFDLRSDPEMQKYCSPIPTIEGVQILRTPVFTNEDYSPESMARCVGAGVSTFCALTLVLQKV